MGTGPISCCGIDLTEGAYASNNTRRNILERTRTLEQHDRDKKFIDIETLEKTCQQIEKLIQHDPAKRGIEYLHIPGELKNAILSLINSNHVIIATGFACCIKAPHTESDGPPGAIICAYSLLKQNKKVTMMIDPINNAAIQPLVTYFNQISTLENKLELYVCSDNMDFKNDFVENKQFSDVDILIASELAGFGADGKFRTMSARDVSEKCGQSAALFDYVNKNIKRIRTVGIGDGGNECGMGNVIENIRRNIKHGDKIGCVIGCDFLITAGVSNWGTEAIAAALGYFCDAELHKKIYLKTSEVGCADGINGEGNGSVDSLQYTEHATMYNNLCNIYQQNQE